LALHHPTVAVTNRRSRCLLVFRRTWNQPRRVRPQMGVTLRQSNLEMDEAG
jgi:hypothetical protein